MKAEPQMLRFLTSGTGSGGRGGPMKGAECRLQGSKAQETGPGRAEGEGCLGDGAGVGCRVRIG